MIRVIALWSVLVASLLLLILLREERLATSGRVPLGRLRRLWFVRERRRAPRYRVDWAIRYRRSESDPSAAARTLDLSQTGVGLALAEKLPVGTLLQLDLNLPSRSAPVSLYGKVIWTREIPPAPGNANPERAFFIGLQFQKMEPDLEQELSDVLAGRAPRTHSEQSGPYARRRRWLWSAEVALSLGFLSALLVSGIARSWSLWVLSHTCAWPLQVALYAGVLWLAWALVSFPLDWLGGFALEHRFRLSPQRFPQWLGDHLKQLAVGGALGLAVVEGLSFLLRATPATWWIWAGILWMAWAILLTRVAPSLLIPLFYQQRRLQQENALCSRLQQLLQRCGTRVGGIFEVNLSRTTRKANACLCGLGGSRRVLLSDTLLTRYPPEEVEVVLAHELGHHRLHHIGLLILTSALAAGASCLAVDRWVRSIGLTRLEDLSALPALGLGLAVAGLALLPLTNGISRLLEAQADRFALRQTGNPGAFIAAMRRLAEQNLAELKPPRWAEWLLHDHPSIARRIAMAEQFGAGHGR